MAGLHEEQGIRGYHWILPVFLHVPEGSIVQGDLDTHEDFL